MEDNTKITGKKRKREQIEGNPSNKRRKIKVPFDPNLKNKSVAFRRDSSENSEQIKEIIIDLWDKNLFKIQTDPQFELGDGTQTPVYIDLRTIISHPKLLNSVAKQFVRLIKQKNLQFNRISPVLQGAGSVGSLVANGLQKPLLLVRKNGTKGYGAEKNGFIGDYKENEKILPIEDITVYGSSIMEDVKKLRNHNLKIMDTVVFLDRESSAKQNLADNGIKLHSITTLTKALNILLEAKKINKEQYDCVKKFIEKNQNRKADEEKLQSRKIGKKRKRGGDTKDNLEPPAKRRKIESKKFLFVGQ